MTIALALLGMVSGILAIFFKSKANSANALLDNQKATESMNKTDQDLSKNNGLLEAEEAKRRQIDLDFKISKEDNIY